MVIGQKVIESDSCLPLPLNRQVITIGKTARQPRLKLALVSCGLGHINRGVEVSTARWYKALKDNEALEVRLFSGGNYPEATPVINLPRDWLLAKVFSPLTRFSKKLIWEFAYGLEQVSFALFLGPLLLKWQPDVVWTKEAPFAHFLLVIRQLFGMKYKIVFANGCGFKAQTYACFDHIQHLHHHSFSDALHSGLPEQKMSVLPNFTPKPVVTKTKEECRKYFGYTADDWVISCVAAWNRHHKRIDYLIEEVAKIKDDKVKLLLCGHPELDTDYLQALARKLLPGRVQWHTLPAHMVSTALAAADVFVLPSLDELFGGVLIEAIMMAVPVIAHHTAASRQLMDWQFKTYDLSQPNYLANCLNALRSSPPEQELLLQLVKKVELSFSEEKLCRQFVEMITTITTSAGK